MNVSTYRYSIAKLINHTAKLCALVAAGIAGAEESLAFAPEGVYSIVERDQCPGDHIDSIVLYTDAEGAAVAAFSSAEYTIVYQSHVVEWDGANELSGYTTPISNHQASFTAHLSDDGKQLTGTVDSLLCTDPWTFTASRLSVPPAPAGFVPRTEAPQVQDLVGSYTASTAQTLGVLKLLRLPDERIVGNFGNDVVPRILRFDDVTIDPAARAVEFFHYDGLEVHVKWTVRMGTLNGRPALQGYGLSRWGRLYPVNAQRTP